MDIDKVLQLYAVRNAIETLAIRAVAFKHTKADIGKLRQLIEVMTLHARAGDLRSLSSAGLNFHEALRQIAGNQYVEKVASLLFDHLRLALTVDNAGYDSLVDVAREHEALIDAIETGDPDKAAQALTTHTWPRLRPDRRNERLASQGRITRIPRPVPSSPASNSRKRGRPEVS
jgi:DNA-binding GntR family transcriptional regulator